MQKVAASLKRKGRTIGFVPTMGALHEGHLSLIRRARRENDVVMVSIFVNPAQFGPREDYKKYPRGLGRDALLCRRAGADIIFAPAARTMYPAGFKTFVEVERLGTTLCGASRPGHFRGVTTVVAKLFNICLPSRAYFGAKDAQQAAIIRRMAEDLNMPLSVKVLPTVRGKDGLALSSRNAYLSPRQRQDALVLSQSLAKAAAMVRAGERDPRELIRAIAREISRAQSSRVDYIAVVDPETLEPVERLSGKALVLLAVWIGKARLIDNTLVRT